MNLSPSPLLGMCFLSSFRGVSSCRVIEMEIDFLVEFDYNPPNPPRHIDRVHSPHNTLSGRGGDNVDRGWLDGRLRDQKLIADEISNAIGMRRRYVCEDLIN